jgi:CRISPR-associated protein Csx14
MVEAKIPVDLLNPGQVFACLGFLEAADVLLGDAEGGFDWSSEPDVWFRLRAEGPENPFVVVLDFLAEANVCRYAPSNYKDAPAKKKKPAGGEAAIPVGNTPKVSETFPGPEADQMSLPLRLVAGGAGHERAISVSHWADGSSRNPFKLYAGNRSAASIAKAMLEGTREKPRKGQQVGDVKALGLQALWQNRRREMEKSPVDVVTSLGGSFNFDPRGAWTSIDAGYSPNDQSHAIAASPVVEILASIGLEHARPDEFETRRVRYGVWGCQLSPILARPALSAAPLPFPMRRFVFELALSGKNKVVTFAEEENL